MANIQKTKIMVFGTFDLLHKGHLSFFKQARGLVKNPFLIVSVGRDINVEKIKGAKPLLNEKERLAEVKKCRLVDRAILGSVKTYLAHIIKEKPKIIALGYDQIAYAHNLKGKLLNSGLKVKIRRMKPYKPRTFKSSILKQDFLKNCRCVII